MHFLNLIETKYQLNSKLTIFCDYDEVGPTYEPYGNLDLSIGNEAKRTVWKVERLKYLSVAVGTSKIIRNSFSFTESKGFIDSGKITLNGKVMEEDHDDDPSSDDLIGKYDGRTFTLAKLKDGVKFTGVGNFYALIKIQVVGK